MVIDTFVCLQIVFIKQSAERLLLDLIRYISHCSAQRWSDKDHIDKQH